MKLSASSSLANDLQDTGVAVIGAGPAGLFAAYRAALAGASVIILEAGASIADRLARNDPSNLVQGFGGAGLFSDGKLTLTPGAGTTLRKRLDPARSAIRLREMAHLLTGEFAAPATPSRDFASFKGQASAAGLLYNHYDVVHVGTEILPKVLSRFQRQLESLGARIHCGARCEGIEASGSRWRLVVGLSNGQDRSHTASIVADYVVLAVGKAGALWLGGVATSLGLAREPVAAYVGFRLEGRRPMLSSLVRYSSDPKLRMVKNGTTVKTHCVCPGGDVVLVDYDGLGVVGGHSASKQDRDRSNTAILASLPTSGRFGTIEGVRALVRRMNSASPRQGMGCQRLADFLIGTPSDGRAADLASGYTPSLPDAIGGDISALFPVEIHESFVQFLHRLSALSPQVVDANNLLYAPAVERWAEVLAVSIEMETTARGLFAVGDGSGLTSGVLAAGESGWLAGDAIARRLSSAGRIGG